MGGAAPAQASPAHHDLKPYRDLPLHLHRRHGTCGLLRSSGDRRGGDRDKDTPRTSFGHRRDRLATSHHCQPYLCGYGGLAKHAQWPWNQLAEYLDDLYPLHVYRRDGGCALLVEGRQGVDG